MGGKSISAKAAAIIARQKIANGFMGKYGEKGEPTEQVPLDNKERQCNHCGFKARYPFIRCPECEAVQK